MLCRGALAEANLTREDSNDDNLLVTMTFRKQQVSISFVTVFLYPKFKAEFRSMERIVDGMKLHKGKYFYSVLLAEIVPLQTHVTNGQFSRTNRLTK